jgi:hypothetical protein
MDVNKRPCRHPRYIYWVSPRELFGDRLQYPRIAGQFDRTGRAGVFEALKQFDVWELQRVLRTPFAAGAAEVLPCRTTAGAGSWNAAPRIQCAADECDSIAIGASAERAIAAGGSFMS